MPSSPVTGQYAHRAWGIDEGLPQGTVHAIVQTRDGYLWAATLAGLVRFDGLTFTVFDVANTPALSSNRLKALYEDSQGTLWIGSEGGVIRYRDGTFARVPLTDSTPQPNISAIREDRADRLWFATSAGLFYRQQERSSRLTLPENNVGTLLVDRDDVLWAGMIHGVARVEQGKLTRVYAPADGITELQSVSLAQDRAGTVWIATTTGLFRLSGDRLGRDAARGWHGAIFEDRDGQLWTSTDSTLEARDATGIVTRMPTNGRVRTITQDREGHIWFGTETGPGLHRLTPRRVSVLDRSQGLPCAAAASVTEGLDGTIWMGTNCKGLVALRRDGRIEVDLLRDGHPALTVLAARDGSIWAGSWGQGVGVLKDGHVTRFVYRPDAPDAAQYGGIIPSLHQDASGAVWTGSQHGVSRYAGGRWRHYFPSDGLATGIVWFITSGPDGAIWIGTSGGVSRLVDGTFTTYTTANGLAHDEVRALHVDARNTVWIGTIGGGLTRLQDGRFTHYRTNEGLFENTIFRILEDDRGALWLTGNRGITRVDRTSLDEVPTGARTMLDAVLYSKADGLIDPECVGGSQPAGWKMRDGTLWIPTMAGVARIDPSALRPNPTPPPIAIEQVTIDDVAYPATGAIDVPPGTGNVEIRYTGLSFTAAERNRFKYRLEGYDSDWVEAGTRRVAYYTRLPPGEYRFRVIGSNSDGTWNETGATLAVALRPHWYQRRLTHVLGLVALAALIVAGHRLRLARLTQRARKLEARVADRTAALAARQTQLAHANERLTDAHSLLQGAHESMLSMLAQLRLGLLVITGQGAVTLANDVVCSLLGITADDARGVEWDRLLPFLADDRAAILALVQTPQAGRRVPVRLTLAGRQHAADVEVQVDPDAPEKRIVFLHDLTELCHLSPEADDAPRFGALYGAAPAMRIIRRAIEDLAPSDATVLVEGETGTGKELVARAIHGGSGRHARPLIAVNCAGLTESLLASQLFGHRRGAFTGAINDHVGFFEAANGGTLFLDEIGDMPVSVQMSLLRVLQEREILRLGDSKPRKIDVRVIAATHRHLEEEVREGRFRQDLFYRICVTRIAVPPLRDRRDDIPVLAGVFLAEMRARNGKPRLEIGLDAMDALCQYDWPGNVRQLRSAIESAVVRAREPRLRLTDLPMEIAGLQRRFSGTKTTVEDQRFLLDAIKSAGGNRALAARLLGISRTTLYRRIASLASESATKMDELAAANLSDADERPVRNSSSHAS